MVQVSGAHLGLVLEGRMERGREGRKGGEEESGREGGS
jgi:hypothetical protein